MKIFVISQEVEKMANNCYFIMKIAGKPDQVHQLANTLDQGLGRVYSFELDPYESETDSRPGSNLISVVGQGDCAWSIKTAIPKLQEESARLGLCIEAFSSEPGLCFQEHCLFDKGAVLADECVDYTEIFIEDKTEEEIQAILEDYDLTREELFANINSNGDYCSGGFDNFGEFEDLFGYWTPEMLSELSVNLPDLPDKLYLWARVGVSLEVTPEVYKQLQEGNPDVLLDVLHGKGGEAFIDGETYFPDIPENLDLVERSYDLGREPFPLKQNPIDLKVLVEGGLVQDVLKNQDTPIHVEVVDMDVKDEDYSKLQTYRDEIYSDPSYIPCSHSMANDYIEDLSAEQLQDKPSLDDIIRQAETEVAKRSPTPPPIKNNDKEPEKDD